MLQSGDIVRIVNKDTRPVTITSGGRSYTLPVGKETAIPFDAMTLWFGDPRADKDMKAYRDEQGIATWIPDRASEVRRLRIKWGIHFGDASVVYDLNAETQPPLVEIYDLAGERIYSVIDDPLGENVVESRQSVAEQNDLLATIQRQQRQIDQLLEAAGLDRGAIPHDPALSTADETNSDFDLPEDDSTPNVATGPAATARAN